MKTLPYTFVALDLETTGLDPHKDTIIEVAAVKFKIRTDGNIFQMIDSEERSMLIDPERKLEENISMITGISNKMLEGKSKWPEVQQRIGEFIGDGIIVGHNVIFDITMLGTHGLDISKNIALDTFELSEIFSMEAESLNLGFLGKHYGIAMMSEHRALDDTKLSCELFLYYLTRISTLSERGKALWSECACKDTSRSILAIMDIAQIDTNLQYSFPHTKNLASKKRERKYTKNIGVQYFSKDLTGEKGEEIGIIKNIKKSDEPLLLLTNGKKQSECLVEILTKEGYSTYQYNDSRFYISLESLHSFLLKNSWNRKESILIIKLLTWLEDTKTGLLDEMKFYGEERNMIELFRSDSEEYSYFQEMHDTKLNTSDIIITDIGNEDLLLFPLLPQKHSLIIKDVFEMEDILRRRNTKHISFEKLFGVLLHSSITDRSERIIEALSYIENVINSVVPRPTGPNQLPPGDFGETYFFTQKALWHRGGKWIPLYRKILLEELSDIEIHLENCDYLERKTLKKWSNSMYHLINILGETDSNMSILIHINISGSTLSLVPRDIKEYVSDCLGLQGGTSNTLLGYGIGSQKIKKFLKSECGLDIMLDAPKDKSILWRIGKTLEIVERKTVILTTNNKHIRQLHQEIKNSKQGIEEIFAQGISGGKGKMLTLFRKTERKSVLIGTIDNWIDESVLWENTDEIIIMKIPFDPPTDPYFLARTVGMQNNFDEYSTPIAINTINTLLGRIRSANSESAITFLDERLEKMQWGKDLLKNII